MNIDWLTVSIIGACGLVMSPAFAIIAFMCFKRIKESSFLKRGDEMPNLLTKKERQDIVGNEGILSFNLPTDKFNYFLLLEEKKSRRLVDSAVTFGILIFAMSAFLMLFSFQQNTKEQINHLNEQIELIK